MSKASQNQGNLPEHVTANRTEPIVRIDNEVTRRIRQHARAHTKTEVCGVLIGENVNGTIEIRASIEALNAAQAGTHVTFTQDAWEEIYRIKDELYPEERIVGWYHSHPGFGVFLSEHDLFIQENFFSSPGQVAWVYDPHTDEEGCFGWVSGKVQRLSSLFIADRNGDGAERTPKPLRFAPSEEDNSLRNDASLQAPKKNSAFLHWGTIFLTHISALVCGFILAYFLFPRVLAVEIDRTTGEVVIRDAHEVLRDLDHGLVQVKEPTESNSPSSDHSSAPQAPHRTAPASPPQSGPRRDK